MFTQASQKPNLVIVRAGQNSLHRNWLNDHYSARNFDVIVSYFNQQAFQEHVEEDGVTAFLFKGGKWDGIYETIQSFEAVLEAYDYVWLPDDDIDCTGDTVNQLFDLMRRHDIKVGQPSLSLDSYFTHFLLIQCPGFQRRYTNFIEVMVPCLHKDILRQVLPEFRQSMSGFGLDYLWCRLNGVGSKGAAIFDSIAVHHTRPVGSVLMSTMKSDGKHPKDEERELCKRYGVDMSTTPLAYAAVLDDGQAIDGKVLVGWKMLGAYFGALIRTPADKRQFGLSKLMQLIRRQHTRKLDLSPVTKE